MDLVPRKVNFLGVNFVVESHVLERHKFKYLFENMYLNSIENNSDKGNIFLSQFVGTLKMF